MNELINFNFEDADGIQTVNARELHAGLGVQTKFEDWIVRRIEKFDFQDGVDFFSILRESTGGRPSTDYHISLSMAKELCMVENNDQGRKIRQYFISVEHAWNTPAMVMARSLRLADKMIRDLKPKALAYDTFMCGKNSQPVGIVAKMFGVGRNRFFQMLRDDGILMQDNVPYQEYMQYFEVIEKPVRVGGEIVNKPVTLINPRGVSYLAKRFKLSVSA
jgi:anti-repressor protein